MRQRVRVRGSPSPLLTINQRGTSLKIKKEYRDDHQVKIVSEFETELLDQFKRRAAREIAKKTKIPGFRPGKAPYQIIISHVGEAAVVQDAVDLMLDDVYPKVIDEADIKPSGAGSLESIDSQDPPTFTFLVPLEPEIDLGNYQDTRKEYAPDPFDEKEVDVFITQLRRKSATIVPLEQAAQEGNLVYFSLSAEILNPSEEEDANIADNSPQQVLIPPKEEKLQNEWPFSGFSRKLIGLSAEDEKEFTHKYPKSYRDEKLKNKEVVFNITIQSVKGLELPELEGDFLKALGDYENSDELRASIQERMSSDHQAAYDDEYYIQIIDQIRENAKIKYPPQLLESEIEKVLNRVEADLKHQNLDLETYFKIRETDKEKFVEEEAKPAAILRLERSLVMNAFSETEGIKLDDERLKTTLDEVMSELIADGNMSEIRKEMGNKQFANAIAMESANRLMNTEIHARLKSIATGEMAKNKKEIEEQAEEKVKKTAAKKKPVSSKPASKTAAAKKKSSKSTASKSAKSKITAPKTAAAKSTKTKTSTAKSDEAKKKKPASTPKAEISEKKEMADLPQSSGKEEQK